jgi:hypothetical protein
VRVGHPLELAGEAVLDLQVLVAQELQGVTPARNIGVCLLSAGSWVVPRARTPEVGQVAGTAASAG